MSTIVFSLNSIFVRVKNLEIVISKLISQCDKLYLNLIDYPPNYYLPKSILKEQKIEIELLQNSGSESRFLKYNQCDDDSFFFPVDDDILYPNDYALYMIKKMYQYNKTICCVHAKNIDINQNKNFYTKNVEFFIFNQGLEKDIRVMIPGVGTSCIYKKDLSLSLENFRIKNMTDPYIAVFANQQNINIVCVERDKNWLQSYNTGGSTIWGNNPYNEIDSVIKNDLIPHLRKKLI
jgi:hypothetical protein